MSGKIGILIENRFIEKEILYYQGRFAEEGLEVVLLTRLWGQPQLTFKGLELGMEATASKSFEEITAKELEEYSAIIVPAGYVADYLLYSETPKAVSPAAKFVKMAMDNKNVIKGFICHSLWLASPIKEAFANRTVTCHNNIISHVENAGISYEDCDVKVDGDLITGRTGGDYVKFAKTIVDAIK